MSVRGFVAPEQKDAFVTSMRVEKQGFHEHVSLWLRHQCVGTLIVGPGDGEHLAGLLKLVEQESVTAKH